MSHKYKQTQRQAIDCDELTEEQAQVWGDRMTALFLSEVDEADIRHEFKTGQCPRCSYPIGCEIFFDAERVEFHFPCKSCDRVDKVNITVPEYRCTIARSQPIRLDYPSLHRGPST